ncbi:MAG: hypothetical protein ACREP6_10405 [Candidatus Binataceae bacterium]
MNWKRPRCTIAGLAANGEIRRGAMDFLLYLSTWEQIVIVLAVFSSVSVLGLYLVRVLVPLERLKKNHEVAGFTFGVIGAFYGLLLAFVIVAAWQRYDRANAKVQNEAMSLTSLYRLSKGFPQPMAGRLQAEIRRYTGNVIEVEWPAMADDLRIDDSIRELRLWQIVGSYKPANAREVLLVDKSFDQLSNISDDLSLRYLYSRENLPSVVWVVIDAGLLITIGFSYFFGLETFKSQALMCAIFSSLLGLTILAILELAHPYQGSVTVSDAPYQYALSRMDKLDRVALSDLGVMRETADAAPLAPLRPSGGGGAPLSERIARGVP